MGTHPIFESDFDCLTEWRSTRKCLKVARQRTKNDFGIRKTKNGIGIKLIFRTLKIQKKKRDLKKFILEETLRTPKTKTYSSSTEEQPRKYKNCHMLNEFFKIRQKCHPHFAWKPKLNQENR